MSSAFRKRVKQFESGFRRRLIKDGVRMPDRIIENHERKDEILYYYYFDEGAFMKLSLDEWGVNFHVEDLEPYKTLNRYFSNNTYKRIVSNIAFVIEHMKKLGYE